MFYHDLAGGEDVLFFILECNWDDELLSTYLLTVFNIQRSARLIIYPPLLLP